MRKKHKITVRCGVEVVEVIRRVLTQEACGNFVPVWCRYKNQRHLVQSAHGDLSDPFRRDESYLDALFIEIGGTK